VCAETTFTLGTLTVTLVPIPLPEGCGARVVIALAGPFATWVDNLSAAQTRELANHLKIAACEAEALEHRARRSRANNQE
jgi:hypothetical protein